MSALNEAKYDICRNYRLDQILDSEFNRDYVKSDLFDYFYEAFCNADLDEDDTPLVAGLRDEISALELTMDEQLESIASLEREITELRGKLERRKAAIKAAKAGK